MKDSGRSPQDPKMDLDVDLPKTVGSVISSSLLKMAEQTRASHGSDSRPSSGERRNRSPDQKNRGRSPGGSILGKRRMSGDQLGSNGVKGGEVSKKKKI